MIFILIIYILIMLEGLFLIHVTDKYLLRVITLGNGIKLEKVSLSSEYDYPKLLVSLLIPGFQLLVPVFLNTMLNNYWYRKYLIKNNLITRYYLFRVNYDDSLDIVDSDC